MEEYLRIGSDRVPFSWTNLDSNAARGITNDDK